MVHFTVWQPRSGLCTACVSILHICHALFLSAPRVLIRGEWTHIQGKGLMAKHQLCLPNSRSMTSKCKGRHGDAVTSV